MKIKYTYTFFVSFGGGTLKRGGGGILFQHINWLLSQNKNEEFSL